VERVAEIDAEDARAGRTRELTGLTAWSRLVVPLWIFASPATEGRLPYWSFSMFRVYIKPALKAAKITGKVGWHTFRHSFATMLKSHGEDVKTVQELLRHANSSVTLCAGGDRHQAQHTEQGREACLQVGKGTGGGMKSLLDLFGPAAKLGVVR
jgi:integrase